MKDLPKVFHNKIDKQLNNNENIYYGSGTELKISNEEKKNTKEKSVSQKINEIFSSQKYVYKTNVIITLKDKQIRKRRIGRNKDYIITMDNELIKISDIIDIENENKK